MSRLAAALDRIVVDLARLEVRSALIGGIAVGARGQERFTKDVDLAVAVANEAEAERVVFALQQAGYKILMLLEHEQTGRLATVRLTPPGESEHGVVVDLLFASSGIEREVVAAAEELEVFPGRMVAVARVEHLIALKILARDDVRRPQDRIDLGGLLGDATTEQLASARRLLDLIGQRGYSRGRALAEALDSLVEELRTGRAG